MLLLIWLVLILVGSSVILLPLALWLREIYKQYSGSRLVACPENKHPAAVNIDARHAAATGLNGSPILRLCDCTRWPERLNCDQACLSQAVHAEPYSPVEVKVRSKPIHHLPIVLAAFAAWYVGAIWHSQYMFRTRWMNALGLDHAQVKQTVWWYWPHLLTVAVCLLFAYGVAWLLAVCHRKGVLHGVLMSVLLCGAVIATNWYGIARLPHDLLLIEAGYTVLATLTVGAIVGGLYDKLVLHDAPMKT
jgi:Protein of unknown function (DUF1761)